MATRDETRRELRELAKLADVMPKERTTINPPAPEAASGPASARRAPSVPPPLPAHALVPALSTPPPMPAPSVFLTPPTPSDSIAPAATTTPPGADSTGGRWGWAAAAGGTLVAAMVGGLLLGQALASHPANHANATAGTAATGATESPTQRAVAAAPQPAPAPPSAEATAAAAESSTAMVVTDMGAPAVTVKSPRPAHHAVKKAPKSSTPKDGTDEATGHKSTAASGSTTPNNN